MSDSSDKLISRPVYVEWVDSETSTGWRKPRKPQDIDLRCWALGFLVTETENSITLAVAVSENGDACDQMTIPKGAITKWKEIQWVP